MSEKTEELMKQVMNTYNEVRKRILLYAQSSLSQNQFEAFRKLTLDEFGRNGAEGKVEKMFEDFRERNGQGRHAICCEKGDRHD